MTELALPDPINQISLKLAEVCWYQPLGCVHNHVKNYCSSLVLFCSLSVFLQFILDNPELLLEDDDDDSVAMDQFQVSQESIEKVS